MFRPFETAVSQYGCQMFSYLEYIFVLAFRIFRKCLTRCLDFFELVTLQGYGISSSGRKRGTSFYNLSPVCVQRRGMVFDPSVLKITTVDFKKDLQSHTILIENQFTEQPVNLRSFCWLFVHCIHGKVHQSKLLGEFWCPFYSNAEQ